MSERLKQFLRSNLENDSVQVTRDFVRGLKETPASAGSMQRIAKTMFDVLHESIESDKDKKSVSLIKDLTLAMMQSSMQPVPRVREALFFPSDRSERSLINHISSAKKQLLVCVFTITNNNLRNALRDSFNRGVEVRIISDDECMKQLGSDVQYLRDQGIPTEIDQDPEAHMHNKFIIVDKEILITGSFNWTQGAVHKNQENLIVLHEPDLCRQYIAQFEELWAKFRPVEVMQNRAATKIQANYRGSKARKNFKRR